MPDRVLSRGDPELHRNFVRLDAALSDDTVERLQSIRPAHYTSAVTDGLTAVHCGSLRIKHVQNGVITLNTDRLRTVRICYVSFAAPLGFNGGCSGAREGCDIFKKFQTNHSPFPPSPSPVPCGLLRVVGDERGWVHASLRVSNRYEQYR